ncbi:hypothetical protein [Halomarina oriensis]|uniref:Uncharacterized protein n=1 Tax=Halomarina oriensis TaxID=671145 RepID=A0A6B0GHG0_9EURY|nr:hypothetical protein [Halomarina oriensis]MWG34296.1 hypothetical protein [Halomarina oriensis]
MRLVVRSSLVLRDGRGPFLFAVVLLGTGCSFVGLGPTLPVAVSDLLALAIVVSGVGFGGFVTTTPALAERHAASGRYRVTADAGRLTGDASGADEPSE